MADSSMVNLTRRTVRVTNLNFKPENAGDELVERVDLSFELFLTTDDLAGDGLVRLRLGDASEILYDDDGDPQLRDLDRIVLAVKSVGKLTLSTVNGDQAETFDPATLKRVVLYPTLGRGARMTCQVRVDPSERLEFLGQLVIDQEALFQFVGAHETAGNAGVEDDEGQQRMAV